MLGRESGAGCGVRAACSTSEMREKGPSAAGEGVTSAIAVGSSIRAVGGGVGDQAEGVDGAGGAGGTAAVIAARRLERKCFLRGHESSVAM
jgi:hypothetical protein